MALKTHALIVTRVFSAPVELVWKAWTDPEYIMRWWGPDYFTSPSARIDFREGGTALVCMRAPKEFGGQDMCSTWVYQKIVSMQMTVTQYGMPTPDPEMGKNAELGLNQSLDKMAAIFAK